MAVLTLTGQNISSISFFAYMLLVSSARVSAKNWANSTVVPRTPPIPTPSESPVTMSDADPTLSRYTTAAINIGDFVAIGFGMTRSTSVVPGNGSLSTTSSNTSEGFESTLTSDKSAATVVTTGINLVDFAPSFTGDCWGQWTSYWSANSSASEAWTSIHIPVTSTYNQTVGSISDSIERYSGLTTVSAKNGVFAQTTFVTVMETSRKYIQVEVSPFITTVYTVTFDHGYVSNLFGNHTITPPSCVLPSQVPQCQSSWDEYVSGKYASYPSMPVVCPGFENTRVTLHPMSCPALESSYDQALSSAGDARNVDRPVCTQASVTGAACSSFVDNLLEEATSYYAIVDGVVVLSTSLESYTTKDASNRETTVFTQHMIPWDPSSSVVPGCTLGCHSCQINGGTVRLIFWAPSSSTWIDGRYSAIEVADGVKQSVVTLGTTLTSPTVYVSFDSLYARDSCSAFSKTYFSKIVAITRASNLSSLWGQNDYNFLPSTASFNFTDLYVSPVPDSIYNSQPRCASLRRGYQQSMFHDPDYDAAYLNFSCPRIAPYEPILSIPIEALRIDSDWADCNAGFNGVFDPPIALTPAAAMVKPTMIFEGEGSLSSTSTAMPASSPRPITASSTYSAQSKTSLPTLPAGNVHDAATDVMDPDKASTLPLADDEEPKSLSTVSEALSTRSAVTIGSVTDSSQHTVGLSEIGPVNTLHSSEGESVFNAPGDDSRPHDPVDLDENPLADDAILSSNVDTDVSVSLLLAAQPSVAGGTSELSHTGLVDPYESTIKPLEPAESPFFPLGVVDPARTTRSTAVLTSKSDSSSAQDKDRFFSTQQDDLSLPATHTSTTTALTHASEATLDGETQADDSATRATPTSNAGSTAFAMFVANDQTFTASRQGTAMILAGSTETSTVTLGSAVTIGGQKIEIDASGRELIIESSNIQIPSKSGQALQGSATTWTSGLGTFTAIEHGGFVILHGPQATATLTAGATTTFASETFGMPASGGLLLHNGYTVMPVPGGEAENGGLATDSESPSPTKGSSPATLGKTSASLSGSSAISTVSGRESGSPPRTNPVSSHACHALGADVYLLSLVSLCSICLASVISI